MTDRDSTLRGMAPCYPKSHDGMVQERMEDLRAALAEPAKPEPSQGWQKEAAMLREQLHQERNTNELLRSQNDKDYWAWQGDGTDHLESMGNRMIVRIFARDLRALLAAERAAPPPAPEQPALSNEQIASACLSYRHDYGLLNKEQQANMRYTAREWERALNKERALKGTA